MMTYAEVCIRERQENVTEDYIRGAVWAIMKVYELVPYDRTKTYKERIDMILDLEKTFPDYIAAEKESFEFNRGATHGLESFALRVAKDESLDYGDRLTVIGGYGNVFDYLLRDCGFETPLAIFADPETPPSPAEITAMTKEFKEHGVKVIFTEPQYPDELAKLIGKETGATVVKIDPVASPNPSGSPAYQDADLTIFPPDDGPGGYYIDVMGRNLEIMKKALAE